MSGWLELFNGGVVSVFGSLLSASFCGALDTKRSRWIFGGCMLLIPCLQGWLLSAVDTALLWKVYPLLVHLPLMLVLFLLTGKVLWPFISILSAYLCCQLRRWIGLLMAAVLPGGGAVQDVVELVITLPLLLLLLHFISPAFRRLGSHPARTQWQLGAIPVLYYCFDYLTRVYTDLLTSAHPAVLEFMPFVCCVAYLVFLLYHSAEEERRSQLQQMQRSLDIQLTQAVREINALRESQMLTRRYRHDLRHHLQYLSSCIQNGQTELAQEYISGICKEIEAQAVQYYCENEAANLILSAFAGRAEKAGVAMRVQGTLAAQTKLSDQDLCVLLSNALENALQACQAATAEGISSSIDVQFYQRADKLFLQVINSCQEEVRFENEIPVSSRPGHGVGVQSICAIVERCGGIYSFSVQDGQFILRLAL